MVIPICDAPKTKPSNLGVHPNITMYYKLPPKKDLLRSMLGGQWERVEWNLHELEGVLLTI